jgi:MazG family protein
MPPPDPAGQFTRLVDIMAALRAPDGCPWDREQTIDTLKPYVLEETYEMLAAIDRHDHAALREELGDFLFEAVFLAQLEAEAGHFSIADSLQQVADKLVRRHPHVFARAAGEPPLDSAGQVRARWEDIKAQERGTAPSERKTLLGGLPTALPALLRAYQIGLRAASVGFDWQAAGDVVAKIREEVDEVAEAVAASPADTGPIEEEVGDLLFAMANLSRKLGVEPETALRKANDKFTARFEAMERTIASSGRPMRDLTLAELEAVWQRVKARGGDASHEDSKDAKSASETWTRSTSGTG